MAGDSPRVALVVDNVPRLELRAGVVAVVDLVSDGEASELRASSRSAGNARLIVRVSKLFLHLFASFEGRDLRGACGGGWLTATGAAMAPAARARTAETFILSWTR